MLRGAEDRITEVAEAIARITQEAAGGSSSVLAEALTNAEERVAVLNEQLGEKAEEAARNAIGQFETMRLAAVAEGQRAVEGVQIARLALEAKVREATNASGEELRNAAGGLVQEVSEAVAEATRRFAKTADELRIAARDMQRELTETREELQKGVLEMPAEAMEASNAMRRAIAEQIDAINELSKIVARSAGETVPAQPRPSMPLASGPVVPPPAAAPAQSKPAFTPPASTLAPPPSPLASPPSFTPPPTFAPSAPFAPGAGASTPPSLPEPFGRPAGAVATDAKIAAEIGAPPVTTPSLRPRRNGEARGWVADLLRRASSDEPKDTAAAQSEAAEIAAAGKRSTAQVVESLNSLSIDIARAIDHEASVELWDRYKRGERNVFTRRLYTLQGQKTFDELRRKYERDTDFRRAVDNYIGDFERLLAQVSKDDSDPAVSRMYLTSDTGKVYTMLAHAAGRLG